MKTKADDLSTVFLCSGECLGAEPYGSGHINDTFRVYYEHEGRQVPYIRQRINHTVFRDVPVLMDNISRVTTHIRGKIETAGVVDLHQRVLTLVPTRDGRDYHVDAEGEFWRCYRFVENSIGYDVVQNAAQAFEVARAFGAFQCQLADFEGRLHETIPHFHHTRSRFDTLMAMVARDPCNRAAAVREEIAFVQSCEHMVDVVINGMVSGEIPERVTHNDTKINNVLLDRETGKGLCVIDLDTVMPGSALYDFGDMVRTTSGTGAEDEVDLSKVSMNIDYFAALVKGYLSTASEVLVPREKELLAFSGQLISLEIGIRFLTDYLEGDVYFKTHRDHHNRDRCRTQFQMVRSIEAQLDAMNALVANFG